MGIEPTLSAWKAEVLPLNYTRITKLTDSAPLIALSWWRGEDSNLRRLSRQIYSLIPLTTREPLPQRAAHCPGAPNDCQELFGAGDRSRTCDLLITNQPLYQLSYTSLNTSDLV